MDIIFIYDEDQLDTIISEYYPDAVLSQVIPFTKASDVDFISSINVDDLASFYIRVEIEGREREIIPICGVVESKCYSISTGAVKSSWTLYVKLSKLLQVHKRDNPWEER